MSKLTTARSTGKSFCLPSDKEIDLWSNQGKRKASLYFKKQHMQSAHHSRIMTKKNLENQQQINFAFNSSINELRQKTRTEKSNSSSISNRIGYLEIELKRKNQMKELAKNKYQKIVEVRQKSFFEKQELNKERKQLDRQRAASANLKASQIKSQRKYSAISTQLKRSKNHEEASTVKAESSKNQRLIAQRQHAQRQKKKRMVEAGHQTACYSRQKLRNIEQSKVRDAKTNHDLKLLQQYMKGQLQRRKNTQLLNNVKAKVKAIEEKNKSVNKELKQYEKMLGWHYSNRKDRKGVKETNSFYLTH